MTTTSVSGTTSAATAATSASALTTTSATDQSNRFLTLLVAQMKNQDPLNPTDNAQITSQMAQISTVSGLDKVNTSISGLGTQFSQLQAMQGAALVGHDVAVEGSQLRITGDQADAGFELSSKADKVAVQVLAPDGSVLDTINMTGMDAGRHSFNWTVPSAYQDQALTFKVTATAGATAVDAMTLETQKITAVSTFNNTLALELANGDRVAYDAVWAFL